MQFTILSPTKARIDGASAEELDSITKQLSYTNKAAQHQVKRHYANHWLKSKNKDAWEATLEELKKAVHNCLVFWGSDEDDLHEHFIRPGSISYLEGLDFTVVSNVKYPTPKKVAWAKPLPFELHPYQEESWQKLIEAKHANVELCTGAGKSAIILKVCRETGFNTAIIAPSQPIFSELLEKFEHHFGKSMVGAFGDGKKKLGKKFTICIDDSIANIEPNTEEWEFFSKMDMICVDESHTWGADTLETICHNVFAKVPYRFFFSGTQTRGDGAEKLLQSIISKTVCTLGTAEAVSKGYICPHDFRIVEIESSNPNFASSDAIEMKRIHFLRNTNIAHFIAKLVNADAIRNKRQSLILVEELGQIAALLPLLKVPVAVAHSEKRATRLAELGLQKCDRKAEIERFNRGEAMTLVGTSCISTGTNIYPTHNCFNWQGGTSEIKTKQGAVGRAVRLGRSNPWAHLCAPKEKSLIWDFLIPEVYIMARHLEDRVVHYGDSESEIKYISLKK